MQSLDEIVKHISSLNLVEENGTDHEHCTQKKLLGFGQNRSPDDRCPAGQDAK